MEGNTFKTGFLNTVWDVLLTPRDFWLSQRNSEEGWMQLFFRYYLPLTVLSAISVFIGEWFGSAHFYIGPALLKTLHKILFFTPLFFICIFLLNRLITFFKGEKNSAAVQKLFVYSMTPYFLISIVTGIFPWLYVMNVSGLYGFYIFWTGAKVLLKFPEKRFLDFVLVSILICLLVFVIISILLWIILNSFF
jgi:hypothetical protein